MAHLKNPDFENKVRSGIIGHAIGDAIGVPVEFKQRYYLTKNPVTDMMGYGTHNMPVGTWSDDTSLEIALIQSFIDNNGFNYVDIMENFCSWCRKGDFTATGKFFDIGNACSRAITRYRMGRNPLECGSDDIDNNGNGSLMRILPVAYVCYSKQYDTMAKYELTKAVSSLTHAHEISILGCYIYINIVCRLLAGDDPIIAYTKARKDDYTMFPKKIINVYHRILEGNIEKIQEASISSKGHIVDSLEAALWCFLRTSSYKKAVLKAVNLGEDTDTIGAITGSLAGIYYGYDAIPAEWIQKLLRSDYLLSLCDQFSETLYNY